MNLSTTIAGQTLRFARLALLAIAFAAALAGSLAPAAADALRELPPDAKHDAGATIGLPDHSLAQPDPSDDAGVDLGDRLPNDVPDLRDAPFRLDLGFGIEVRSDLLGSCVTLCTDRTGLGGDALVSR